MKTTLTDDKLEAEDKLKHFLLDDSKQIFILSGAPGVGKTFFIDHIISKIFPEYKDMCDILKITKPLNNILLSATTNPAANLHTKHLCTTIHRLLGLTLRGGILIQRNVPDIRNSVVVIDEYTMLDRHVKKYIDKDILDPSLNNKLILSGDQDQFLAIAHKYLVFTANDPKTDYFELTVSNRTDVKGILDSAAVLREWIRNPTSDVEWEPDGVAVRWSSMNIKDEYEALLQDSPSTMFLTYKNQDSRIFNAEARKVLNLGSFYTQGEVLILNKPYFVSGHYIPVDSLFEILSYSHTESWVHNERHPNCSVDVYTTQNLTTGDYISVAVLQNPEQYTEPQIKYLLEELDSPFPILDLRPQFSKTFHKAQGSSVDNVLIDLSSFPANISRDLLLRSLYVAITRARKSVVMVGEFNETVRKKI